MRPAVPPEPGQPSPVGLGTPPLTRPGPQATGASPPRSLRPPAAHLTLRLPRAFKLGPTGRLDASVTPRPACRTPARPSGCRTAPPPQAAVLQWGRCSAVPRLGRGWGRPVSCATRTRTAARAPDPDSDSGLRHVIFSIRSCSSVTLCAGPTGLEIPYFPASGVNPSLLQPMRAFFA